MQLALEKAQQSKDETKFIMGVKSRGDKETADSDVRFHISRKSYEGKSLVDDGSVYEYDFLVNLPDMNIVNLPKINIYSHDGIVDYTTVLNEGMKNVESKNNPANTPNKKFVNNKYTGRYIQITKNSIKHGMTGNKIRTENNAKIGCIIGDIVENAVPINELSPRTNNERAYIMIGTAQDAQNTYFVSVVVNETSENMAEVSEYNILEEVNKQYLYAANAKKIIKMESTAYDNNMFLAPGLGKSVPSIDSTISIANLLDIVKNYYGDGLSKNVLNKLNMDRPQGTFTGQTRFSLSNNNSTLQTIRKSLPQGIRSVISDGKAVISPKAKASEAVKYEILSRLSDRQRKYVFEAIRDRMAAYGKDVQDFIQRRKKMYLSKDIAVTTKDVVNTVTAAYIEDVIRGKISLGSMDKVILRVYNDVRNDFDYSYKTGERNDIINEKGGLNYGREETKQAFGTTPGGQKRNDIRPLYSVGGYGRPGGDGVRQGGFKEYREERQRTGGKGSYGEEKRLKYSDETSHYSYIPVKTKSEIDKENIKAAIKYGLQPFIIQPNSEVIIDGESKLVLKGEAFVTIDTGTVFISADAKKHVTLHEAFHRISKIHSNAISKLWELIDRKLNIKSEHYENFKSKIIRAYGNTNEIPELITEEMAANVFGYVLEDEANACKLLGKFFDKNTIDELVEMVYEAEKVLANMSLEKKPYKDKNNFGSREWRDYLEMEGENSNREVELLKKSIKNDIISTKQGKDGRYIIKQDDIDNIVSRELKNIIFSAKPVYNSRIKCDGLTTGLYYPWGSFKEISKIEIGKQSLNSKIYLMDTLIHEELEARIISGKNALYRKLIKENNDNRIHKHINRVIKKYFSMKGW